MPCTIKWPSYILSLDIVKLCSILIHCCRFSLNVVGSQSESSNTSPKSPESCRLRCRGLCSMIGWSGLTVCSILIHCCRFPRNVVGSQSESSIMSPKNPGGLSTKVQVPMFYDRLEWVDRMLYLNTLLSVFT